MSDTRSELAGSWLAKARRDLLSAQRLASSEPPLFDTAAYHCQQAAEKSLKAFLVYADCRFGKMHDLDVLLSQVVDLDPSFSACRNATRVLNPLATAYRYPGELIEPDADEYREAYEAAAMVFEFVVRRLPGVLPAEV
jgi:HEPN domain-containing protein